MVARVDPEAKTVDLVSFPRDLWVPIAPTGEPERINTAYNVTKAALLMFSKNLAAEVIKDNIRVNTINPGLILTPDWVKTAKQLTAESGGDYQAYLQSVAEEHAPIKRFGTVEELANFFVFLCSDRASYSVGSTYHVDGGMLRTV